VLTQIAHATSDPDRHAALWRHGLLISRSVNPNIREPLEREQINDLLHQLAARTAGRIEDALLEAAPSRL
jgi:hypothetical protein